LKQYGDSPTIYATRAFAEHSDMHSDYCLERFTVHPSINSSMNEISREEIEELGKEFDITVRSDEIDWVTHYVNSGLSGLDDVDDLPVTESSNLGERSRSDPAEDPYSAINVECDVPPTDDHSGLLDGLTVGVIIGPAFREDTLLSAAQSIESFLEN